MITPTHTLLNAIAEDISRATGCEFRPLDHTAAGGGCINRTWILEGSGRKYFVKLNDTQRLQMFEAELAGLKEIASCRCVRVPEPILAGSAGNQAYLVLEYLNLSGGGRSSATLLGNQLAAMHRCTNPQFGWWCDNTIGTTTQPNTPSDSWLSFYRDNRLRHQLSLAIARGARQLTGSGERLLEALPYFFTDYRPVPSLLHGDLWSGNHGALPDETPVIFDPAVYYGDRETDLAMTELFGGFDRAFYAAYEEVWPLDPGYRIRKNLYNLYHVLNHFNLFGGGYAEQAGRLIDRLLNEV